MTHYYNGYDDAIIEDEEERPSFLREEPRRHGQIKMAQFHRLPVGSKITLVHEGSPTTYTLMQLVELKDNRFIAKVLLRSNSNQYSRFPYMTEMHYSDCGLKPYTGGRRGDLWNPQNWIRVDWVASPRNIAARARRLRQEKSQPHPIEGSIRWQEAGF